MELEIVKDRVKKLEEKINKINIASKLNENIKELKSLEEQTYSPDFYTSSEQKMVLQKIKVLKSKTAKHLEVCKMLEDAKAYIELYETETDAECLEEAVKLVTNIDRMYEVLEVQTLLCEEYDTSNAIVTIHPGAGGTESQDWAQMLFRMYTKWVAKEDFEMEILDMQPGDEAGIKSVSFIVKGVNAYGYLKAEKGVHRLVRISPFDSNSRRHTSFAAVEVMPEIDEDINVDIRSDDIEIDTFRASGAGGQHINKTDSAIRIRHLPTGIVVACQTQRSQLQNKENAMKMLRSKIYEYERIKNKEKLTGIKGESLEIAWGSQIRSYVFCPYTLVKDHRTNYEIGNIQAVMDGKLDEFMHEYLKYIRSSDTM